MASLTREERATLWALRLKASNSPNIEIRQIRQELDGLVYTSTQKSLSKEDKVVYLSEVRAILAKGRRSSDGSYIINAADNSGVLDIVDSVIDDIKG